ncbi:glycosyltransferase family 4 protein [Microbulbifer thermotolerans]|uniref:glycosyltransferase family 4 protein n=1 Tax=Microbulbifer thermotolerans TaxID=252514 RepID=UPI002248F8FA|nr:glycosyltransferase family 4 protein [Microbulbifer thermotolerans]MCX2832668.1 glycosyltransferase family 4 protein [Microbulbifer thermotolerans]
MTKLLILSVDFFPKIGGISLMTHHLANGFCQIGWDVTVVGPFDSLIPEEYTAFYKLVVDRDSKPELRAGVGGVKEKHRIIQFLNTIGNFDHVLLLHPFYYGPAAIEYARKKKIKISCYFHGFELKSQLLHKDRVIQRFLGFVSPIKSLRQLTLSLLADVDYVLTNSSETADVVNSIRTNDVFITGCGLDLNLFRDRLLPVREKNFFEGNEKTLGFVGRLVESKNVEFLIFLLDLLPSYRLLVVGDGPDKNRLQKIAKKIGVYERIIWLGKVSEEDKWYAIDRMDLLCLPSKKLKKGQMEGFGIVMLEATLRGVPIAVSHEGGMRDFVLENNGIYLDIKNKNNSAKKITDFLSDKDNVIRAVGNAQKLLGESLTYDKIAKTIASIVKSTGNL